MRTLPSLPLPLLACGAVPALAEKEPAASLSAVRSSGPITVGKEKQLFIDDRFIASSRNVELCMNPPVKLGVVLRPDRPWEDKSIGFCASVMEHGGVFKLFYRADSHEKGASVCLATSRNGLHWERLELAFTSLEATKTTTSSSATRTTMLPTGASARRSCSSTPTAVRSSDSR